METFHRRALITLALSGAAAVGLWATLGRDRSASDDDERGGDAEGLAPRSATPERDTAVNAEPQLPAHDSAGAQPAAPDSPPGEPSLQEQYPSPYAGESPEEERRLLELTVEHQEKMIEHAEERLQALDEQAAESDEAEDEFEAQRQAIQEGREQTEAFKQRLRQLKGQTP